MVDNDSDERNAEGQPTIKAKWLSLPGWGWAKQEYQKKYKDLLDVQNKSFFKINSIPDDVKDRIKERVMFCHEKIGAISAWVRTYDVLANNIIFIGFFISPILSLVSAPVLFYAKRSWLEWLGITIIALIISLVSLAIIVFVGDWPRQELWVLFLMIAYILAVKELFPIEFGWLPDWLEVGFIGGLLGGTIMAGLCVFSIWSSLLIHTLTQKIINLRHAKEDIVDTLTWVLAEAEKKPDSWDKNSLLWGLEDIARRIETDLPRGLLIIDRETYKWLREHLFNIAAEVRFLKHYVLIPTDEHCQSLKQALSSLFVNMADGYWLALKPSKQNSRRSRRSSILDRFRTLISIVFPLLIVGFIQLNIIPITISDNAMDYIILGAFAWIALNILAWVDPSYEKKLSVLEKGAQFLIKKSEK